MLFKAFKYGKEEIIDLSVKIPESLVLIGRDGLKKFWFRNFDKFNVIESIGLFVNVIDAEREIHSYNFDISSIKEIELTSLENVLEDLIFGDISYESRDIVLKNFIYLSKKYLLENGRKFDDMYQLIGDFLNVDLRMSVYSFKPRPRSIKVKWSNV